MDPRLALIGLGPVGLGLVFATIGWLTGHYPRRGWQRAQGTLVMSWQLFSGGRRYRWVAPDGVERVRSLVYRGGFLYADGTPVTVLYDPRNYDRSVLDSPVHSGLLFLIVGGLLMVMGVAVGLALLWFSAQFPPR